jgi:hypothetical protein
MRIRWLILLAACLGASAQQPQYTKDGDLIRPDNYREWIFLSAGLGMTYGPAAEAAHSDNPPFDNVFVSPAAYRVFLQTGTWPDKTMFALEIRSSVSKGSINSGGHYQEDAIALEASVKDQGKWAYFGFGKSGTTAKAMPASAGCNACHSKNAAVDNTFVQFYPTLLPVAKAKGTLK